MSGARTTRTEVELQERHLAILQGLFESRLMTLTHVTHLFFNRHGEAAKKRIQRLKEDRMRSIGVCTQPYLGRISVNVPEATLGFLNPLAYAG
jgi:hypothetical protein